MKIMLGTVQFGIPYGAFNASGKVAQGKVSEMLEMAAKAGVRLLDTARAYGEAEATLARAEAHRCFGIVSKCPDLSGEADPVAMLEMAFDESIATLGVKGLYGYLLHNAEDLTKPGIWDALLGLREAGRVKRVGVSGYDIEMVSELCNRYPITLVQLPANVLDPWYERISLPEGVEVHVRSAFLQGFLLSDPSRLPPYLASFRTVLEQFCFEAEEQRLTPLQAALAPLLNSPTIAQVVVGVENSTQLEQILEAEQSLLDLPAVHLGPYEGVTKNLIDPRQWGLK